MPAPTTAITLIKQMPYRGNLNEKWSNHYMLTGTTPADATAWRALFDALVLEEKKCYPNQVKVVGGYGYNSVADNATAVWTVDLNVTPNTPVSGTMTGTGSLMSGDQAAWVRWGLDRFNSKGKRIYLRKYFHGIYLDSSDPDKILAGESTVLAAFGTKLRDGSFSGGRMITDRLGTAVVGAAASTWVTTRTLKRRGKRPGS